MTAAGKNREAIRSESIRLSRLIRLFLLQAGTVTGFGDDVFFLSLDEMTELLNNNKQSLSHTPVRQDTYKRYRSLPPYPALIFGRLDPFRWAASSNCRSDFYDARQTDISTTTSIIQRIAGMVREYTAYFNQERPHQGMSQYIPAQDDLSKSKPASGQITSKAIPGGLHHNDSRATYLN